MLSRDEKLMMHMTELGRLYSLYVQVLTRAEPPLDHTRVRSNDIYNEMTIFRRLLPSFHFENVDNDAFALVANAQPLYTLYTYTTGRVYTYTMDAFVANVRL